MNVGTQVEWKSQAGGYEKKKVGVIVEVVPPGESPKSELDGPGMARKTESYVVLVGKTNYWPIASKLREVVPDLIPGPLADSQQKKLDDSGLVGASVPHGLQVEAGKLADMKDKEAALKLQIKDQVETVVAQLKKYGLDHVNVRDHCFTLEMEEKLKDAKL